MDADHQGVAAILKATLDKKKNDQLNNVTVTKLCSRSNTDQNPDLNIVEFRGA